jgi:phosphomannomutase
VTIERQPSPGAGDGNGTTWPELAARARAWVEADPDPVTREELTALVAEAERNGPRSATARAEVTDRFAGALRFGTAGLRGALGAGPMRMNRAVVITAAAGLASWLTDRVDVPGVVIGFDARHGSAVFATDSAAVLTAAGCRVRLLPYPLPTPVLAFAVRRLHADAGVMVTASHNPPGDNGYKVYLGGRVATGPGDGVQLVPPADTGIAGRIARTGPAVGVPRAASGWTTLGEDLVEDYLAAAGTVLDGPGPRALSLVVTPLHGVGGRVLSRALLEAGFDAPFLVPQQAEPDPDFPTVAFPNPEEPGAMDLALAAADERGADLVIATDPDADRCAVAVRTPSAPRETRDRPGWRILHGDELGALLAEHLLSRPGGIAPPADGGPPTVASSIVSSQLLGRIASAHGVRHVETLTGFKWIARVPGLVYGYEEALGYCVAPGLVRDKDGITAALLVAELAARLGARGRSLLDALEELAVRYGVHVTEHLSVRMTDPSLIGSTLARLRADPPGELAGSPVTVAQDLGEGGAGVPPTDGLRWCTGDGIRVVVRPSGTEPKLKCYLEVALPPGGDTAGDHRGARARLGRLRTQLRELLDLTG